MSRESKLRSALEGTGLEEEALALARLSAAEVDVIVAALKASRRAGAAEEKGRRRQRRADRPKTDDSKLADAAGKLIERSLVPRAAMTLETLTRLKRHYDDGPAMLALAVAGARAQGYTDVEIAQALAVTRDAVGRRFGRRGQLDNLPLRVISAQCRKRFAATRERSVSPLPPAAP